MKIVKTIVLSAMLSLSAFAESTNTPALESSNAWVVSLGGAGTTATVGDHNTSFGADISVGRTGNLLLPLEAGIRQGFSYDSTAVYNTRLYSDWTVVSVAQNTLDVFAGANVGITYGDVQATWTAAPEAGLRWWIKKDVAVLFRAEFPFRLNDTPEFTDSLRYFLGFSVRF